MTIPKLLSLLSVLEVKQIGTLKKYLLTKTSKSSDAFALFEYVISFRLKPDKIDEPESILTNIFPTSSIKAIHNNMSLLYTWSEEWAALQQLNDELYSHDMLLLKWFNKNGLYELADSIANKIEKNMLENKQFDIDKSFTNFSLLFEQHFSNNPIKYHLKEDVHRKMIESFNEYVRSQYLILQCELSNWGGITHSDYDTINKNIEKTIEFLEPTSLTMIIDGVKDMVIADNLESLLTVKNTLNSNAIKEGSKLHYIATSYAINASSKLWNKGQHQEKALILDLVQYGISSGFYFRNGKIQSAQFHNLVMYISVNLSFEEVEKFIEENIAKVNNTDLASTKLLAMAQNCFYHHRYEEVESYTRRNNFSTFNQKNIAQGLHLIATYMNKDNEPLLYEKAMTATVSFLKRNKDKMSSHLMDSYYNLIKFIKDLTKGSSIKIEDYRPLIYSSWCQHMLKNMD